MYECEICKFKKTTVRKNYENHLNTNKHKNECSNHGKVYSCRKCKSVFKQKTKRDDHYDTCSVKKNIKKKTNTTDKSVNKPETEISSCKKEKETITSDNSANKLETEILSHNKEKEFDNSDNQVNKLETENSLCKKESNSNDKPANKLETEISLCKKEQMTENNEELEQVIQKLKDTVENIKVKDDSDNKVTPKYNENINKNLNSCFENTEETIDIAEILADKCANSGSIKNLTHVNYEFSKKINKKFIKDFLIISKMIMVINLLEILSLKHFLKMLMAQKCLKI